MDSMRELYLVRKVKDYFELIFQWTLYSFGHTTQALLGSFSFKPTVENISR